MIVEFRSEDGKPVKHVDSEELSDDAVVELLTLQAGDSVSFEVDGGQRRYQVLSSHQRELFPLQSADAEPVNYLIFFVKPMSESNGQ